MTDWPLLEYDEDAKRYVAAHHPFTSPKADIAKLGTAPEEAEANAYDIVLNGYELGGGSIRIHDGELQEKCSKFLDLRKNKHRNNSASY